MSTSSATVPSSSPRPTAGTARAPFASRRFYACLVVLVASAAGLPLLAQLVGAHFRKKPVPLKAPLTALRWAALEPEYRPHLVQPPPLRTEDTEKLGTEDYVQVRLMDTRRGPRDALRIATVFITYYTGKPDMVPHVPDECYQAGGYDAVGRGENRTVTVPGVGAPNDAVPVRVMQFQSRSGRDRQTVLYFFHTNGQYTETRDGVRVLLANPFARYAYYAKIEVTFSGEGRDVRAGKEESLQALGPLLQKLMPVLLSDHFAWDRVLSGQFGANGQ